MRHTFLFLCTLLYCNSIFSQNDPVNEFVSANNLTQASIGLLIKDLDSNRVIASHQANVCRNPASVTKIITTATAMELLGDTFRFSTKIEYSGEIIDSTLHGNLYIRGGGDPTLESRFNPTKNVFYSTILDTIIGLGIKHITGHIIGDASLFREDGAPFDWLVEDMGSHYSPTPSSLSAHDNLLSFAITSDSTGLSVSRVQPYTRLFQPKLELTAKGDLLDYRITKSDFSWQPIIRGAMPKGSCQTIKTELAEPALFLADSLRNLLISTGITVDSLATTTRWHDSDTSRKVIYNFRSASLKQIAQKTNYISINLFAENIFLTLSQKKDSLNPCNSWMAAEAIRDFWRKNGVDADKIFQVDGSGMSTKNAISPQFLVDVLDHMYKKGKCYKSFLNSLPVAGRSGTVASFMKGTKLEGNAFVKSGSMTRVQNYAGYIHANDKWYAFCLMVSNFTDKPLLKKQMSKLLNDVISKDSNLK